MPVVGGSSTWRPALGPRSVMWWAKWHRHRFFAECLVFLLSASFHQCSIIVFIYVLLLLPEGQKASIALSKIGELEIEKYFFLFLQQGLTVYCRI
jgi:hypothetical protein